MSKGPHFPPIVPQEHHDDGVGKLRRDLRILKSTLQAGQSIAAKNTEKMVQQVVMAGLKMASSSVFYDPLVAPLRLAEALKGLGISVLGWAPEVLMATIDQKFAGWSQEQVADALDSFHKTGVIKTEVPQLVREKIYALRVIATSNSAQTEWHIFEKVGGALNDRVAQFGVVEPLSAAECAKTVAIIEDIRPDTYENEIKVYIAASCHMNGLLTVLPVKWLSMAETYLQQMNYESTGEQMDLGIRKKIVDTLETYRVHKTTLREVAEDLVSIQATKLLGIDEYAEAALREA